MDDRVLKAREIDEAWRFHAGPRFAHRRDWLQQRLHDQGNRCHYCESLIALRPEGTATLDHIIPLSRGGEDILENTVAACEICNCAKGNLLLPNDAVEFEKRREKMLQRSLKPKWRGSYSFKFP